MITAEGKAQVVSSPSFGGTRAFECTETCVSVVTTPTAFYVSQHGVRLCEDMDIQLLPVVRDLLGHALNATSLQA
mgnify:CR=1 FL=1